MEIITTDILRRELGLTEVKIRTEFRTELDRTESKLRLVLHAEMDERFGVFENTFVVLEERFDHLEKSLKETIDATLERSYARYAGLMKEEFQDYFKGASELTTQNTRNIHTINDRLDNEIEPRLNRVVFQLKSA